MNTTQKHRPPRKGSLRSRIFRTMRRSKVPLSTVEIQLCSAFHLRNGLVRVYLVLIREELFGRVVRLPPVAVPDPAGARPGRRAVRWQFTPLGELVASV